MEDENIVVINEDEENQEEMLIETEVTEETDKEKPAEKLHRLPLARIKTLMKLDPDLHLASQEATFLIAKATELFIEVLTQESYSFTQQAKKKTLQKKDLEAAVDQIDALVFLEGTLND